jgi:hypothetical protein
MATQADSIASQEEKIRTLLQQHVHRMVTREHEDFPQFLGIMAQQKQWATKVGMIRSFKITRSSLNKALLLQVNMDNSRRWYTVSWRKGVARKRKPRDPLQSALRQAVHQDIQLWKKFHAYAAKCVQCESQTRLEADHDDPSFQELTQNFLANRMGIPKKFGYDRKTCGKKFLPKDILFRALWQEYHRKNARLQWLCKKCNLAKKKN